MRETILFNNLHEIADFVSAAESCPVDIDICKADSGKTVVDAKSLMGVIGLGTGIRLSVLWDGENKGFAGILEKLAV